MVDTLTELIDPDLYMRLTSLYMSGKLFKCSLRCRKKQSSGLNWRAMGDQETWVKKKFFFSRRGKFARRGKMVDTLTKLIAPVLHMRLTSRYRSRKLFKCSLRCRKKQSSGLNWDGMGDQGTWVNKKLQNLFSYFFARKNGRREFTWCEFTRVYPVCIA